MTSVLLIDGVTMMGIDLLLFSDGDIIRDNGSSDSSSRMGE